MNFEDIDKPTKPENPPHNTPFFVYGTLRPDDCTAEYCKEFLKDGLVKKGWIPGARLFFDDKYPVAVLDQGSEPYDETRRPLIGYFVFFQQQDYLDKLALADRIEDYPSFYQRSLITGYLDDDKSQVSAWIYHRQAKDVNMSEWIKSGDWLQRRVSSTTTTTTKSNSPDSSMHWLFGFGSLMNKHRMAERGIAWTQRAPGTLPGYRLVFNKKKWGAKGIAFANISISGSFLFS